jgi:SAM-dependent methyltransferase
MPAGARVLDVGCGNNSPYYFEALRPDSYYIGLDVGDYDQSEASIYHADEYHVSTPSDFAGHIDRFRATIDCIVSSHNLEHCDDYPAVLRARAQALKPGGRIFFRFPARPARGFRGAQGASTSTTITPLGRTSRLAALFGSLRRPRSA